MPKGLLLGLGGSAAASACSLGAALTASSAFLGAATGGSSLGGAVRAVRFKRRRSVGAAVAELSAAAGDIERLAHLSPLSLRGAPKELPRSTPRD